jgi:hypothetical protein
VFGVNQNKEICPKNRVYIYIGDQYILRTLRVEKANNIMTAFCHGEM